MKDEDAYLNKFFPDEVHERILLENPQIKPSFEDYCPTCNTAKRYVWRGQEWNCDCQQQLHLHLHYLNAGIGTTYQRQDWADYDGPDEHVQLIGKYVDKHHEYISRGVGLFFYGEYGVGKTMVANLALKEFVKRGYRCYATTFANTVEMFTAGWKKGSDQRQFQKRFMESQVLLLDDVGREQRNNSRLAETTFDNILRTRVQHGRPTFLTTNMTLDELGDGYGGGTLSLLREKSIVREFLGHDYRGKANARELDEIKRGEVRPIV